MLSHVRFFATPWTAARQALLSMGFPRQEYWSELSFPPPRDLANLGIEPTPPVLQADSLPLSHQGSPVVYAVLCLVAQSCLTLCDPEGNGNPLQYFCLGNPMDGESW